MTSAKDSSSLTSLLPRPNPSLSSSTAILCKSRSADPLGVAVGKENVAPPATVRRYRNCDSAPAAVAKPSSKARPQPGAKVPFAVADNEKCVKTGNLKPSSLQICMRQGEPERSLGISESWEPISSSSDVWYFSDNEAAPASSWSTLPNRLILYRPLPVDVGRCTCIIVKEKTQGLDGVSVYSLYTNEGHGREDRKLAVARHKRRNGRSEFIVAQNISGIFTASDDSFLGSMTANLLGTQYHIWDQGCSSIRPKKKQSKLLGVVEFVPTITTLTGSFRNMRAWIPKQHSMQLKSTAQVQHVSGLPWDFREDSKSQQLSSRVPRYNSISKRYELDFRERGVRVSPRIQSSVKNFQLTLDQDGRQSIVQLGRVGKMKFLMEYRYPLTGYQAFCICLASIDSKLCCSL